jgi:hypothetical protein
VKKSIRKKLAKSKRNLDRRLDRENRPKHSGPVMGARNIRYEYSGRMHATGAGGIGAFHKMVNGMGLVRDLNANIRLLKIHKPYHESDHILNIVYNVLVGGVRLEDIELLRQDAAYMDALGAERIPDPTTAGDFLRRFDSEEKIVLLMDTINAARLRAWERIPKKDRGMAFIDVDGSLAETTGECKEGMDISYNGIWGYHPLIITLANTDECLYIVNRPANRPSHDGAAAWIDQAVDWVRGSWDRICLRGDTDFSLTENFDRWTDDGLLFVLGFDASKALVKRAEALGEAAWALLDRPPKYTVKTEPRRRPENVKEQVVRDREFTNKRLAEEHVAEFPYRPTRCSKTYRMVVVRKKINVEKGQGRLFDEYRYFFYITNRWDLTPEEVVFSGNKRCDQENTVEQLKNGVNALRLPMREFHANWAYMVTAALAWNLKAWFAMHVPDPRARETLLRTEFRTFLNAVIRIPCQIVNTGGQIVYRILQYNSWLHHFFETFDVIRRLRFA